MSRATLLWLVLFLLTAGFAAYQGLSVPDGDAEVLLAATPALPVAPTPTVPAAAPMPAPRRPLFAWEESTSPSSPPLPVAAEPVQALRLAGVIIDGQRRLALVEERRGQPPLTVGEGGILGPWTIVRVERHEVLLRRPEGDLLLRLDPPPR